MRLATFKELTRFEQTLFGLPFIVSAVLLALLSANTIVPLNLLWIVCAFLLARISGMAFNQLIDREIDAKNPRTSRRAIPSGRVSIKQARWVAWSTLIAFMVVCFQINLLISILAPLAALLLYIYSYVKRVHAICHLVLGTIHFLGPVMAYGAITGTLSKISIFLGGMNALLIIGTDLIYAIQDYEFDCKNRLHSIPARFGIQRGLLFAVCFHALCPFMLLGVGVSAQLPLFFYLSIPCIALLLLYFHVALRRQLKEQRVSNTYTLSFFGCNVAMSTTCFLFIAISVIWLVMS